MTDQELLLAIDARFAAFGQQVDARFAAFGEQVDARFAAFGEQVDARFAAFGEQVDARFAAFGQHVDARFDRVESEIRHNGVETEDLRGTVQKVAEGVDHVQQQLDAFRVETRSRFDGVERRLDLIETIRH